MPMNDRTQMLIENLAAKLNTTTEHLWGVLLRQAEIQFWLDIAIYTGLALIVFTAWKFRARADASDDQQVKNFALIIFLVVIAFASIIFMASIEGTITEKANPEFWALEQIFQKRN